jgi:hypothetical protein
MSWIVYKAADRFDNDVILGWWFLSIPVDLILLIGFAAEVLS